MDESCWTPLNLSFPLPIELMMTLSEEEVPRHMNGELEVVSIACGLVGGESLLPTMPESIGVLISQITNHKRRYHCLRFLEELLGNVPIVHIDDVCEAHILCMEKPFNISGRFLCASAYLSSAEIASHWKKHYPDIIIDEEFVEDLGREISWDSTKLKEIGFEYKFDSKMILDESLKCAQKTGEFVSSQQIMDDHAK